MAARGRPRNDTVVTVEYLNRRFENYYDQDAFWHFMTREVYGDDGDYEGFVQNPDFEKFKADLNRQLDDVQVKFQQKLTDFELSFEAQQASDFKKFKADLNCQLDDVQVKFQQKLTDLELSFEAQQSLKLNKSETSNKEDQVQDMLNDLECKLNTDFDKKLAEIYDKFETGWHTQADLFQKAYDQQEAALDLLERENRALKAELEAAKCTENSHFQTIMAMFRPSS
ncbi:hypothetical protein CYMTET_27308 [Cymbomonas tetramitiformis]|uniref:Uncharacterized protein n=1 Tax=Cymbomonas tetramitiformis TaxID=36881 RepID=A0AAE0FQA5_9CHLO|nr:hypothetical protein CYMTET_27308 [Cymbomonas tetramitiformis]